jgi:hypothetical protein
MSVDIGPRMGPVQQPSDTVVEGVGELGDGKNGVESGQALSRISLQTNGTKDRGGEERPKARGRSAGGRPRREGLTPLQHRGISALLTYSTITVAAAEIGVHPRTISRWLKERRFRAEYVRQANELQLELWHQMLAERGEAWGRFQHLMRGDDERIALRATTWLLDRMLSVPAIIRRDAVGEEESGIYLSPRLRALLDEVDAIDLRGDAPE